METKVLLVFAAFITMISIETVGNNQPAVDHCDIYFEDTTLSKIDSINDKMEKDKDYYKRQINKNLKIINDGKTSY